MCALFFIAIGDVYGGRQKFVVRHSSSGPRFPIAIAPFFFAEATALAPYVSNDTHIGMALHVFEFVTTFLLASQKTEFKI